MSRALGLLTHLSLLAPCGGSKCRVIISPLSTGCCCLGVKWASWASMCLWGLLVALGRAAQPSISSCSSRAQPRAAFLPVLPVPPWCFQPCPMRWAFPPVAGVFCASGQCRLPVAGAAALLGLRGKDGLPWALWGVLLGALCLGVHAMDLSLPGSSWVLLCFVGSSELRLVRTQVSTVALLLSCSSPALAVLQGDTGASPEPRGCLACAQPRGKGPFPGRSFSLS